MLIVVPVSVSHIHTVRCSAVKRTKTNSVVSSARQHAERAIANPSVRPSVRHSGGSVENG